jgi:hypothetical protein
LPVGQHQVDLSISTVLNAALHIQSYGSQRFVSALN